MHEELLNQARDLHRTVRMVQAQLVRRFNSRPRLSNGQTCCTDLTLPQCNALMAVREAGEMSIKELSEALQVSSPSASAMVERLVEMNMLEREQSKVDRREVRVRVSEEGLADMDAMEAYVLESIVELLEQIGPEYSRMWCDVYARIREVFSEERQHETVSHGTTES